MRISGVRKAPSLAAARALGGLLGTCFVCAKTAAANAPSSAAARRGVLFIVEFFQPSHLNRFQLGFVGFLRIVVETFQFRDPLVQVREANEGRVLVRI